MQCPICSDSQLAITDRQGIEIDYCPRCRGVWLDRGELDKLIERSEGATGDRPRADYREHRDNRQNYRPKSLLRELFD